MGDQDTNTDRDDAVTNGSVVEFVDAIYTLETVCSIIFKNIGELSEKDKECRSKINFICDKIREISLLSYPKMDESINSIYKTIGPMVIDQSKLIDDKLKKYINIGMAEKKDKADKIPKPFYYIKEDFIDATMALLKYKIYPLLEIINDLVKIKIVPSIDRYKASSRFDAEYNISDMHTHFKKQCSKERYVSYLWAFIYFISMIFLAAFLCYLWTITMSPPDDLKKIMSYSDVLSINFFILKSIITVLFITLSVWCAKMYSRACHRMTLNAHRANILKTLKNLLYTSANNQKLSEDIIREGMRSVFAPIDTGYLKKGGEMSLEETLKIIDAMKGLTKSKG